MYVFLYGCSWIFPAAHRLSLAAVNTGTLVVHVGFSLQCLLLLGSTSSRAHGLQQLWLTSFVSLRHVESSWTGDQTLSPELAGRFLTTGPPGKSSTVCRIIKVIYVHYRNYVNTKKDKNVYLLITIELIYKSSIFFSLFLLVSVCL